MTNLSSLNEKQLEAVISEEKRLLVLAGAGSGKTKTLIQKVLHLISEKNVKPSQILAITFTKNAANEMLDRLIISDDPEGVFERILDDKEISKKEKDLERIRNIRKRPWIENLTVRTFHSLCYKILSDSTTPDVFDNRFKLITNEELDETPGNTRLNVAAEKSDGIIYNVLLEKCSQIPYLLRLKRYLLDYYVDRSFHDKGQKTSGYTQQVTYTTLRGEKVKSKSERDIADWFYRHQIDYTYEPKIVLVDFSFKPDFFIPKANLYLEHISDKSYTTKNKEEQFKKAGIECVKTYEHIMNDTSVFNQTMERIIQGRLDEAISPSIALNFNEEFKGHADTVKEFLDMVLRLQGMMKSYSLRPAELLSKSRNNQHERVRVFYELAIPLIEGYKQYCTNKSYLDFDDLILETIRLLETKPDVRERYQDKFKYILVDEFQDVNHLQVRLLKLLLSSKAQLFCVGDDWQSIYGFRGSEVKYIVEFEKFFRNARVIKLYVNYRSNETIVGASNEVIKKNKFKVDKEVTAYKKTPSKIQIYRAKSVEKDGVGYLVQKVQELQELGLSPEDILILYRRSKMYQPYRLSLKEAGLKVSAKTIHASKGLEAKVVFIIGLTEGRGGFPDVWLDDIVFRVVKDIKQDMLLEEERRLFYVALTRAKEELYLITAIGNESPFIDEIPKELYAMQSAQMGSVIRPIILCESCGTERKKAYNYCPTCGTALT